MKERDHMGKKDGRETKGSGKKKSGIRKEKRVSELPLAEGGRWRAQDQSSGRGERGSRSSGRKKEGSGEVRLSTINIILFWEKDVERGKRKIAASLAK